MTPEIVNSISERYIELYEQITGDAFIKNETSDVIQRIEENVKNSLNRLLEN
ncbi:phosphoribosylaminoimidazole-succinocarboxamide synthase [compost metagenome]